MGNGLGGGFDLLGGGASLPVVHHVIDSVEPLARHRASNSISVISVRYQVAQTVAKRMLRVAMKNGNVVAGFEKPFHELSSNKQCPADYQNAHGLFVPVGRSPSEILTSRIQRGSVSR
jgi:hypothetical protein